MSFNNFMHPRNPFRIKPNYELLASKYPEFKKYLITYPINKKFKINFDDVDSLQCLTKVLLKETYNLTVEIPINRLIPAIPQRLNYILWIEDIIEKCFDDLKSINGIDIGTGSICIFPLISCKKNKNWSFLATELDDYSLESANLNIKLNNLNRQINVIKGDQKQLIPEFNETDFIFLMCNPPFFQSKEDNFNKKHNQPRLSNTSIYSETVTDGGEENFVLKLLEESFELRTRIKLYTVMLGRKESFKNLKRKLNKYKEDNFLNFIYTEFYQGTKIRWGLCWSFDLNLNLESVNYLKIPKKSKLLTFKVPVKRFIYTYSYKNVADYILQILDKIEINFNNIENLKKSNNKISFTIKTNVNSWSNQRFKRRHENNLKKSFESCSNIIHSNAIDLNKNQFENSIQKNKMDLDEINFIEKNSNKIHLNESCSNINSDNLKSVKVQSNETNKNELHLNESNKYLNNLINQLKKKRNLNDSESSLESRDSFTFCENEIKKIKITDTKPNFAIDENYYLLDCVITIKQINEDVFLELQGKEQIKDKRSVHQLFQYLINNLN